MLHPKKFPPHQEKTRAQHLHVVEKTQCDTKEHVDNAKNHRHFHLKRIEEGQFIGGNIPNLRKTTLSQPNTE